MADFNAILQKYVNKDYSELLSLANGSYSYIYRALNRTTGDEDLTVKVAITLMMTAICADGQLSDLEVKFMNDFLGRSYSRSEIYNIAKDYGNSQGYKLADEIFDIVSEDVQAELLNLCLCICAIDERISKEEINYLLRLAN